MTGKEQVCPVYYSSPNLRINCSRGGINCVKEISEGIQKSIFKGKPFDVFPLVVFNDLGIERQVPADRVDDSTNI